jgi:hypothetical protein
MAVHCYCFGPVQPFLEHQKSLGVDEHLVPLETYGCSLSKWLSQLDELRTYSVRGSGCVVRNQKQAVDHPQYTFVQCVEAKAKNEQADHFGYFFHPSNGEQRLRTTCAALNVHVVQCRRA